VWCSQLGNNKACHVGGNRCFENNTSTTATDPKDGLKDNRLNATATARDKTVKKIQRVQTTLQITDLLQPSKPNNYQVTLHNRPPSPTAPLNTALTHSENPTKNTTCAGQSNYTPHRKHGVIYEGVDGFSIEQYLRTIADSIGGSNIKYAS
jgi:hypothetical protein